MAYCFQLPDVGEGMAEAEIVRWLVPEGGVVEEDQPVVEVQTDKAIVELPSPRKGKVLRQNWDVGSVVPVGETLFELEEEGCMELAPISVSPLLTKRALATPSVRRLAKEMSIDLRGVNGTGKEGRILAEDLHRYLSTFKVEEKSTTCFQAEDPLFENKNTSEERALPGVTEFSLSPTRRVIGERLLYSVLHKPHAIHFDELDVEGLVEWKKRLKQEGVQITYTALLLKLIGNTLKHHPLFNAHYDEKRGKIIQFDSLSIGIATDTPKGLLVPVIHEVEKKNILELSAELEQLTHLARAGKCGMDQLKGSGFTLSNAGALGGKWAVPIINPPEVAIIALHSMEQRPVVEEGAIVPRWRMNVSLAFDHRILDGADAIRFTQTLSRYTREPSRLLQEFL